jgi:trehalose/maltose transport system substrate-binding protein
LPRGGASLAATLGGLQLAVSRYSRHQEEAVAFVRHMTSPTAQVRRAAALSYAPTILALYEDPEVMRPNPYYSRLRTLFAEAVARPSTVAGRHYGQVSEAYFTAVHSILTGSDAAAAVAALEQKLVRITGAPGAGAARAGAAGSRP